MIFTGYMLVLTTVAVITAGYAIYRWGKAEARLPRRSRNGRFASVDKARMRARTEQLRREVGL